MFQLITGLFNILQFYPWPWGFIRVHYWMSWVVIGSLVLHIAVQLPAIRAGPGHQAGTAGDRTPGCPGAAC